MSSIATPRKLSAPSIVLSAVADAVSLPLRPPAADVLADRASIVSVLYERHKASVFAAALRYGCGDRAFAEDVLQDVFVSLLGAVDGLTDLDDLAPWFRRVTVNACINRQKRERLRRSRLAELLFGPTTVDFDPGQALDRSRAHDDALLLLRALPPKERVVFCLVHVDNEPQTEVCRVLGCSKGYASKLVARAEVRVRALGFRIEP
jgi:RNA polymerase sigma-70 factor, ECF subfamily